MFSFVALGLEVEVVLQWVVLSSLSDGCAVDCDVEFTPSLFADLEGWLAKRYYADLLATEFLRELQASR